MREARDFEQNPIPEHLPALVGIFRVKPRGGCRFAIVHTQPAIGDEPIPAAGSILILFHANLRIGDRLSRGSQSRRPCFR